MTSERPLLNPGEVATILGVDRSTAEAWMVSGEIPSRNISTVPGRKKLRTTREHIDAFLAGFGSAGSTPTDQQPSNIIRMDRPAVGTVRRSLFR